MFHEDFYPTPLLVKKEMYAQLFEAMSEAKIKFNRDSYVLDPSCGKGDLLGFECPFVHETVESSRTGITILKRQLWETPKHLYGVELIQDLQEICKSKDIKIIGGDFLTFNTNILFDAIIMNPPFSNGAKHLLKAWEFAQRNDKCVIVCLLNKETILNPFSQERKLLNRIINEFVEVEDLGSCFQDSERPTNVEVVMVTLTHINKESRFQFDFKEKSKLKFSEDKQEEKSVSNNDFIKREELCLQSAMFHIQEIIKHSNAFISLFSKGENLLESLNKKGYNKEGWNVVLSSLNDILWEKVFSQLDIQKRMDVKTRQEFEKYRKQTKDLEFNQENVMQLLNFIAQNGTNIYIRAIESAFDIMTSFDKDNKVHVEGWAHNDAFKVNKKVIVPYGVKFDSRYNSWRTEYGRQEKYSDIDKAMSYITGVKDYTSISDAVSRAVRNADNYKSGAIDSELETTFFYVKLHKKGTVHLRFKDEWALDELNLIACKSKNWLRDKEEYNWRNGKRPQNKEGYVSVWEQEPETDYKQLLLN